MPKKYMVYHYVKDGEYLTYEMPMSDYTSYDDLKARAAAVDAPGAAEWEELPIDTFIPWNEKGKGERIAEEKTE